MRRALFASLAISGLLLAACGDDGSEPAADSTTSESGTSESGTSDSSTSDSSTSESSTSESSTSESTTSESSTSESTEPSDGGLADCAAGKTISDGVLTIATGEPAFPPYVIDDDPTNKEGFESAVAWAIADRLGFDDASVTWVRTTFDEAIQPGPKNFDFNLQQYSITPERAESISFSKPYYTSNQAIVGLDGSAAEGATSLADLKDVKFGVQAGTTSLQFVTDVIQPSSEPFVYDDNVAAKAALEANQIDAIVVDLPTAFYISAVEIEGSSVIAQFPASAGGTTDEFGLVFEQGNPLVECVDMAIDELSASGELQAITDKWMSTEMGAPIIPVG